MDTDALLRRYQDAIDNIVRARHLADEGNFADAILVGKIALETLEDTLELDTYEHPAKDEVRDIVTSIWKTIKELEE